MNHTPTGWSAPGEVATPITIDSSADRSADRSRSDHGVRPGRPVACVAPKAITDRAPQHHIIHSDVENVRAEDRASGDESEDDDLIADAEYAIQQKELDILRLRRDMVARRANKSKKSKASSGGDIDDILGMMADEDNTHLNAGVLRDHEKNVSLQATQEASSSSAGALVHPPGLMLRDGAYHLDSGFTATTEVTQDVVHTYTPTRPTTHGPYVRDELNKTVVEVANRAYSAGAIATGEEAERRHAAYMQAANDAFQASEMKHTQDAINIKLEAERLHQIKMDEANQSSIEWRLAAEQLHASKMAEAQIVANEVAAIEANLVKQEAERLHEITTSAAALEARSAIALASARGEQTIEQANEYAKYVHEESQRLTNAAHAAFVEEKAMNS
ncbi:unnamed protein product, partial [Polarella glacialis]